MTDEEIRIEIARSLGWKMWTGFFAGQSEDGAFRFLSKTGHYSDGWRMGKECRDDQHNLPMTQGHASENETPPDFPNDLNAMASAEKSLNPQRPSISGEYPPGCKWPDYIQKLLWIAERDNVSWAQLTARQRAEAYLRTIGKWRLE